MVSRVFILGIQYGFSSNCMIEPANEKYGMSRKKSVGRHGIKEAMSIRNVLVFLSISAKIQKVKLFGRQQPNVIQTRCE